MPAQPKTPAVDPKPAEGTPEVADKDAQVLVGVQATPDNGSPRRNRRDRKDRGPRPEHAFLISVHAALAVGVPVETITPITAFAKRAEGAAAWNMLRKTLDDRTREVTGEPEPDEPDEDAESDEDDDES
jgi:hypothetical protein